MKLIRQVIIKSYKLHATDYCAHNLFSMRKAFVVFNKCVQELCINCASAHFSGGFCFRRKCVLDVMDKRQELFIINTSTWSLRGLGADHHFCIHTNIDQDNTRFYYRLYVTTSNLYTRVRVCHQSFSFSNDFVDKNETPHPSPPSAPKQTHTRNDTIWYSSSCSF